MAGQCNGTRLLLALLTFRQPFSAAVRSDFEPAQFNVVKLSDVVLVMVKMLLMKVIQVIKSTSRSLVCHNYVALEIHNIFVTL